MGEFLTEAGKKNCNRTDNRGCTSCAKYLADPDKGYVSVSWLCDMDSSHAALHLIAAWDLE